MFAQRWLRLLPGRSQWVLLAVVAVAIFLVVGFADLAVSKRAMRARYDQAAARVELLRAQNIRLQQELERAQGGQYILPKAYDYFGVTPPGVTVVVAEPEAPAAVPAATEARPSWVEWLRRLLQP